MARDVFSALDLAALTDVGKKRQRNEDAYKMLIPPSDSSQAAYGAVFIVADGMGGLGGGDVASKAAIDALMRHYYSPSNTEKDIVTRLQAALESANVFVRDQAGRVGLPRIGSTAAGIVLKPDGEAVIFNVGDCRVYRVRKGKIERISRDQSVMERQVESGLMTEEVAKATRNSMVTAFLGQPVPIKPFFTKEHFQPGDVYLICSDGLWGLADYSELHKIIRSSPAKTAVQRFINLALSRGGGDNITSILVRFGTPPGGFLQWLLLMIALAVVVAVIVGLLLINKSNGGNQAAASPDMPSATPTVTAAIPTNTPQASYTQPGMVEVIGTDTPLPVSPTHTLTAKASETSTSTDAPKPTLTSTATATATHTYTLTATLTNTATSSPIPTATPTKTASPLPTATFTVTFTPTWTPSLTNSPEPTVTLNATLVTYTPTMTRTRGATSTPTATPTFTLTPTGTQTLLTPSKTPIIVTPRSEIKR